MPIVSIITPTYNRSQMLKRAIESVLAQRFQDWELIIVDDVSPDDTQSVVSEFKDARIKYIRLEANTGGSFMPRQRGFEASGGEYIAVLDDDDYWSDDRKLELQVAYLNNHPECMLVGADAVSNNGNGSVTCINFPKSDHAIRKRLLTYNCFCHSAVMYRRETINKIGSYGIVKGGYYDGQCNEYDLWARMGLVGKMVNLPIYGVSYNNEQRRISFLDRLIFWKMYVDLIMKYRREYPNWALALLYQSLITIMEFPLIVRVKNYAVRVLIK